MPQRSLSAPASRGCDGAVIARGTGVTCSACPAALSARGLVFADSALMTVLQVSASLLLMILAVAVIARGLNDGRPE